MANLTNDIKDFFFLNLSYCLYYCCMCQVTSVLSLEAIFVIGNDEFEIILLKALSQVLLYLKLNSVRYHFVGNFIW